MAGFRTIPLWSMRVACLCGAVFVYALFGSPTPDHPGIYEIIVAILLIAAIGLSDAAGSLYARRHDEPGFAKAGRVFLIYGLSIPLLCGVMNGNPAHLVLRDILPFLFMMLPVFLWPLFQRHPRAAQALTVTIVIAGLLFSMRALCDLMPWQWLRHAITPDDHELFYLANAPTVLFAALFLAGFGGYTLLRAKNLRHILYAALPGALCFVPVAAMVLAAQRASLAAFGLYILLLAALAVWKKPQHAWRILIPLGAVFIFLLPDIAEITRALLYKTREVGMNMRWQETRAVWETVSQNPLTLLFGTGWGGTFTSPATGGAIVNFTHNFFTSFLLKGGLVAVLLACFYIAAILEWVIRIVLHEPVRGLALAAPVLIDILFYASFKSLDFGVVLALVPASLFYLRDQQLRWPALEKREEANFWVLYADNRVEICLGQQSSS